LTIKSAQHTTAAVSCQWSVVSQEPQTWPLLFTVHWLLSTALLRRSAYASPPGSTPGRASTGRHRTISCQRTLSVEGLVIEPSTSFPVWAFSFRFQPQEAGFDSPDVSGTSNSTPALHRAHYAQ